MKTICAVLLLAVSLAACNSDIPEEEEIKPVPLTSEAPYYCYYIKEDIMSYIYLTDDQKSRLESKIISNELVILKLELSKIIDEIETMDTSSLDDADKDKIPVTIDLLTDMKTNNDMADIKKNYCDNYKYTIKGVYKQDWYLDSRIVTIMENYATKSDIEGLKSYIRATVIPWLEYELSLYDNTRENLYTKNKIENTISHQKQLLNVETEQIITLIFVKVSI